MLILRAAVIVPRGTSARPVWAVILRDAVNSSSETSEFEKLREAVDTTATAILDAMTGVW